MLVSALAHFNTSTPRQTRTHGARWERSCCLLEGSSATADSLLRRCYVSAAALEFIVAFLFSDAKKISREEPVARRAWKSHLANRCVWDTNVRNGERGSSKTLFSLRVPVVHCAGEHPLANDSL